MNYVNEMCAFKEWKSTNELSKGSLVLWYSLKVIQLSNHLGTEFNAPNKVLKQLTGLSKQGIVNARLELEDHGLLHYQNGYFGKAGTYHMISVQKVLKKRNKSVQPVDPVMVNSFDQVKPLAPFKGYSLDLVHSLAPSGSTGLTVLKEEEVEEEEEGSSFPFTEQEINPIPIQIFEDNFGFIRPVVKEALLNWCMKLGEDLVIEAINIAVKMGAQTYTYLEKILREWERANLKTLQQVQIHEMKKEGMKRRKTTVLFQQPQQQPYHRQQLQPERPTKNQSRPYHPNNLHPSTEENSFFEDLLFGARQ